jgi:hypothetical protein
MDDQVLQFHKFLIRLPTLKYPLSVTDFLAKKVPTFASLLGYQTSQLYFSISKQTGKGSFIEADAIVAAGRTKRPWILIEVDPITATSDPVINLRGWRGRTSRLRELFSAKYAVMLTPFLINILSEESDISEKIYSFENISLVEASEIYTLLHGPLPIAESQQEEIELEQETSALQKLEIKEETFHLQLDHYSRQLNLARRATTNDEKKISFENLARLLFESIPFLACRASDLRTSSSEIDLVIEYCGWTKPTLFDEFGRFCLVECKNWKEAVGASQVRDFIGKLAKARVKLGILFARNGITGENNVRDALNEIRSAFSRDGIYILVIAEEDLINIQNGTNFYKILDEKMFQLRFDDFK